MGWEGREWAKWSDEERDAYLEGRAPRRRVTGSELVGRIDSPYSSGISLRVKVWGGLAATTLLFVAILAYGIATTPLEPASADSPPWHPLVLYGWVHVRPMGSGNFGPSSVGTRLGGRPLLCTARQRDEQGGWVCTEYSAVDDDQRVVVMPPDSTLTAVPCNTHPKIPCP